ncbi:Tim10/DDP family zinc finger-domain-containing protein [Lentinula edodes]|uniref:Tim10/DDP family zinc finger-domain-containing protein n=1 Tax=Lentinula edodes TaxID=5353 RepID=UPI001E8DFA0C|nr:Tim10/DDP family zinc finger-domain-containing protein [Lentinula edodes]KAH7880448.1 Tim10/DDP family zinc finger-domain-containing protein [Lentinula edodes]KAJ3907852.1 Tim10/DDP family zinc finger-domain-containing protein [Lentinula edodes]KAJ3919468.1 Tim10/DDP family zinc finger-domain-containing protein [Lentinula edodes]
MSFLSGARPTGSTGGVNTDKIEMAITELDTITDFFNRMVASCHAKCITPRYTDGELNKGEMVCIDRCVSKYNEVQKKVGEKIQSRGAAAGGAGPGATGLGF